jgi:hypothetical protein
MTAAAHLIWHRYVAHNRAIKLEPPQQRFPGTRPGARAFPLARRCSAIGAIPRVT